MIKSMRFHLLTFLFLAIFECFFHDVNAYADLAQLTEQLMTLRKDVEALNTEYELEKTDLKAQQSSLYSRKQEVESLINSDQIKIKDLQMKLSKLREMQSKTLTELELLRPEILDLVKTCENVINTSLPFKLAERKAVVQDIREKIEKNSQSLTKSLSDIWNVIEDELRLSSTLGFYKDNLAIDGQQKLVEIARLGTVAYFFRTINGGASGYVYLKDKSWQITNCSDKNQIKAIHALVDSFKFNIKTGNFALPSQVLFSSGV